MSGGRRGRSVDSGILATWLAGSWCGARWGRVTHDVAWGKSRDRAVRRLPGSRGGPGMRISEGERDGVFVGVPARGSVQDSGTPRSASHSLWSRRLSMPVRRSAAADLVAATPQRLRSARRRKLCPDVPPDGWSPKEPGVRKHPGLPASRAVVRRTGGRCLQIVATETLTGRLAGSEPAEVVGGLTGCGRRCGGRR